ncbi:MAG: DUF1036 domain-containing protein [Sneathiellales bacterium]|nr:DUF1036 domain-containing protein [Sneathiellales bacterium]
MTEFSTTITLVKSGFLRFIGIAGLVFGLLLVSGHAAQARIVSVCNAAPYPNMIAVAYSDHRGEISEGWHRVEPGNCKSFRNVKGNLFHYYATSGNEVARWMNSGSSQSVYGRQWRCVGKSLNFTVYATGKCKNRLGFAALRIPHRHNVITVRSKYYKKLALNEANEVYEDLLGRWRWENQIRKSKGREAPFQIGVRLKSGTVGLRIAHVQRGMPAYFEGMEVGDEIVKLDSHNIRNRTDVRAFMDNLSIFRTTPVNVTLYRNGQYLSGEIEPMFFPFSHKDYSSASKVGTFIWSTANNIMFGFGNEVGCTGINLVREGLSSLVKDRKFNGGDMVARSKSCSNSANVKQAKYEILHQDAANAAFWASLVAPGIPVTKFLRNSRAVPLAARSRFIRQHKTQRRSF